MKHIVLLFLLGLSLFACTQKNENQKKPNIIYILADDMGYGDVSYLNKKSKIPTPNIDRLGKDGMIFTDAHSGSAVCTPTRYGIITGRYAWRSKLKQHVLFGYADHLIETGRSTVPSLLKKHGYKTAAFGKWHLGMDLPLLGGETERKAANEVDWEGKKFRNIDWTKKIKNGPNSNGFDYFYGIPASLDMDPYVYIENDRFVAPAIKNQDWVKGVRKGPAMKGFKLLEVLPTITRKTVEYINEQKKDTPFFIYMALTAPHTPIVPVKEFQGKTVLGKYGDFCTQVDNSVAQVLNALDDKGLAGNTIVIFTSDNGCSPSAKVKKLEKKGHFPSYIYRGYKSDIFEGGHRIPFLIRWPGKIKPSTISDETICLTDLMATCAAIVGDDLKYNEAEDSYNILPVLKGEQYQKPLREATVHHSYYGSFAIRQGKWKLEVTPGSGGWGYPRNKKAEELGLPPVQLYDLENDVAETTNIYKEHPEVVKELTALLEKYKKQGYSRHIK